MEAQPQEIASELRCTDSPQLAANRKQATKHSDDQIDQTLIFDIGVNAGEDTSFYLRKGFRVVGVEANPRIFKQLQSTFAEAIANGSLTLLNVGIWNEASILPFYVNIDNDHWSSFDPEYGCRQNTQYEIINIPCVSIRSLIDRYGVPRYMKVDIEGGDKLVLADLRGSGHTPPIISVEEFGNETIPALFKAGYRRFKLVPQRTKETTRAEGVSEGLYVQKDFNGLDSGVFGLELTGAWLSYDHARSEFRKRVRTAYNTSAAPEHEWYDVHAITDEAALVPSKSVQWLWRLAQKQREAAETFNREFEHRTLDAQQALEERRHAYDEERRLRTDAERQVADQRKAITDADSRSSALNEQLRIVRGEVEEIRSSRTWRMFGLYRSLRRFLSTQ